MTARNFKIQRLDKGFLERHVDDFVDILKDIEHEYWREDNFLMDLPEKWLHSLVALDDNGKVVAYIIASIKGDSSVHIHKLMVNKSFRSQGLGRQLLLYLCDRCVARKVETLSLKIYEHNLRAIDFYEEYGFERVVTGQDLVEMRGNISEIRAKTDHGEGATA